MLLGDPWNLFLIVFFLLWILTACFTLYQRMKSVVDAEDQRKATLTTDLRSVEMELLAVQDQAKFLLEDKELLNLIRVNPHSLGLNDSKISNVINQKNNQFESYIFDIFGKNYEISSGKTLDSEKIITGTAVTFKEDQIPKFLLCKATLSPLGFIAIDRDLYPKWFPKDVDIYGRLDNATQVIKWVELHESLLEIWKEPTLLLMRGQNGLIEAYYQGRLPAKNLDYNAMKQKVDLIAGLRIAQTTFFDPEDKIKFLKNKDKNGDV